MPCCLAARAVLTIPACNAARGPLLGFNVPLLAARVSACLQALEVAQGLDALGDRDWDLSMALCFVWVNVSLGGLRALKETVVWCVVLTCSHRRLWSWRVRGSIGGNMQSTRS